MGGVAGNRPELSNYHENSRTSIEMKGKSIGEKRAVSEPMSV